MIQKRVFSVVLAVIMLLAILASEATAAPIARFGSGMMPIGNWFDILLPEDELHADHIVTGGGGGRFSGLQYYPDNPEAVVTVQVSGNFNDGGYADLFGGWKPPLVTGTNWYGVPIYKVAVSGSPDAMLAAAVDITDKFSGFTFNVAEDGELTTSVTATLLRLNDPVPTGVAYTPLSPPVVPEPISSALFIVGAATLGLRRFRKTNR